MAKLLCRILLFFLLMTILIAEGKKISRSRSSSRSSSSSRRTSSNHPAPTSVSHSQASAPKPTLFGWQEKSAQKTQKSQPRQSKPGDQKHSYPSSNTGLSGSDPPKKTQGQSETIQRSNVANQQSVPQHTPANGHSYPASNGLSGSSGTGVNNPQRSGQSAANLAPHQVQSENIQRSNIPNQQSAQQPASYGSNSHSYPASNGLSGNSGTGAGYPQGTGLSGSNVAPPPYQASNSYKPQNNLGNGYNHPQGPPPPYPGLGNNHNQHGPPPQYSGYGNMGNNYGGYGGGHSPQMPGYFGGYSNNKGFGGMSRGSSLAGVGIAGAGIGTILTGLALWNLARSTGHHHHTVIYDNRGQPVAVAPVNGTDTSASDSLLADLVNCTLTISTDNATEVLAIPCSIATSFTPDAGDKDAKVDSPNDNTKCTITVVTKSAKEFMTTIPCSVLLNTAAQNNVTEPPPESFTESTANITISTIDIDTNSPSALKLSSSKENIDTDSPTVYNCTSEPGDIRDPINPCFSVNHNLTVVPLASSDVQ
ncbi:basic salivary proline-rich protein 2-like [Colias croceus]|uniref:basic salivary proline-rich protein 2-like n=1 Tax=Colias crocea TaxID=72248 RepID=UPI001E280BCD|nr:basic salivary proline-rich protein 2-like [Colias croceus]